MPVWLPAGPANRPLELEVGDIRSDVRGQVTGLSLADVRHDRQELPQPEQSKSQTRGSEPEDAPQRSGYLAPDGVDWILRTRDSAADA